MKSLKGRCYTCYTGETHLTETVIGGDNHTSLNCFRKNRTEVIKSLEGAFTHVLRALKAFIMVLIDAREGRK